MNWRFQKHWYFCWESISILTITDLLKKFRPHPCLGFHAFDAQMIFQLHYTFNGKLFKVTFAISLKIFFFLQFFSFWSAETILWLPLYFILPSKKCLCFVMFMFLCLCCYVYVFVSMLLCYVSVSVLLCLCFCICAVMLCFCICCVMSIDI